MDISGAMMSCCDKPVHPCTDNGVAIVDTYNINSNGGFLSHRGTPRHHPSENAIFPYKPSIF